MPFLAFPSFILLFVAASRASLCGFGYSSRGFWLSIEICSLFRLSICSGPDPGHSLPWAFFFGCVRQAGKPL